MTIDGILLIDKPEGMTSADVVRLVKCALRCKVGHLGTLDPFASGLLPLCLGEGTKISQFLNASDKAYEGVIRLGERTDTGDREGTVVETRPLPPDLTPERCAAVAASFVGEGQQVPPMYSAVKQGGVPLYKLARRGMQVEREARPVIIHSLTLEPVDERRLRLLIHCSKGTYVRVVAEQIGLRLGSVAHLASLRRTRFGRFRLETAVAPTVATEALVEALISPRQALEDLDEVEVDAPTASQVKRGQVAALARLGKPRAEGGALKLVGPDGSLLAVVTPDGAGHWHFARVMCAAVP